MKLWLITRTDEVDWDETNAILVRAMDKRKARSLALGRHKETGQYRSDTTYPDHEGFRDDNLVITEVTAEGEQEVIIIDFLRG
jgi:hypothetical protein